VGELVDLGAERALRELAAMCQRRPDIGEAVQAAAAAEGGSMGEAVELDFLTVEEAAEALRLQPVTIRLWIRKGKLPAYHAGRRVLLRRADVAAMVCPGLPGGHGGGDLRGGR